MNKQIIILVLIVSLLFVGCDNSSSNFDETSSQIEKDSLEETTGEETTSEENHPEDTTDEETTGEDQPEDTTDKETTDEKKEPVGNVKDFDIDSYEYNTYKAVISYFCNLPFTFEEGDTIKIDDLMLFYGNHGIFDNSGKVKEEVEQYKCEDRLLTFSIPKEVVHVFLTEHLAIQIDASYSKYTDPSNEENYLIDAYGRGYEDILMKDVTVDGNRITGTFMYADFRLNIVYDVREICFEMIDETDFRFIYAKDLFTISEEEIYSIIRG